MCCASSRRALSRPSRNQTGSLRLPERAPAKGVGTLPPFGTPSSLGHCRPNYRCQQDLRDGVPNCHSAPAKAVGTLPVSQTLPCTLLLSTLQTVARREDFGVIETQGHISRRWTMLFSWRRRRRRRKLLAEPFPQEWLGYLQSNVAHYANLDEVDKTQLRDDLRVFIAEKRWEGCGGLQLTDEMKITIAAQACLLVLH